MISNSKNQKCGQFHHRAKLTDREVELMRQLREDNDFTYETLAGLFEVTKACVQHICSYRNRTRLSIQPNPTLH